ncbi:MAG: hypothetical protein AAGC95_02515 [Pseudomonadota bacterium]
MTILKEFAVAACAASFLWAAPGLAESRIAVGGNIGTTGVAADVQFKVNDFIVLRGGGNYLEFELNEETYDDIEYDAEIDFTNFAAFVDLHPFANAFTISGGVYVGDKGLSLDARPIEPVEIGGQTFTPEQVGSLVGDVDLEDAAPYLGLGFNNAFTGGRLSFSAMAGVMFTGDPDVSLNSEGGILSDSAVLRAELDAEEENLEADVDDFEFYPVLTIGLNIRF